MLTARGSMLLLIAAIGLVAGLLASSQQVALASLTLLLWIGIQWLAILWLASKHPLLRGISRQIDGQMSPVIHLTINQPVAIRTRWIMPRNWAGLRFQITDVLPDTFWEMPGESTIRLRSRTGQKVKRVRRIRPAACGHFELAGLAVQISDWAGLFHLQRFSPCHQAVTVLPWLIRPQTIAPVVKPHNVQGVPGQHAFRRAGLSAELLGIRDYQTGDPPRTIAWKATARTGRLMSREFEMEVPIRATMVCGLTHWQYAQRPETAVADRVITAAASIARLLLADRDPVALMLASEKGATRLPHGNGQRHLVRLLHQLLDATSRMGAVEDLQGNELYDAVLESAWRRFPELFDQRINSLPPLKLRLLPERRRLAANRRRLAMLLCQLLDLPAGSEFRLACNGSALEAACCRYAQRFSIQKPRRDSGVSQGTLDEQRSLMHQISRCLLQAQSRARDNELFVIIAEFANTPAPIRELTDTIRLCRAARHRVIAVDTPAGMTTDGLVDKTAARILAAAGGRLETQPNPDLHRELTRLGVRYARLEDPRLMQIVINELEMIRSGRGRSGSQRAFAH